jgi:hypothetical protein
MRNKILKSTGAEPGIDWMPRELEQDKLKKRVMDCGEQETFFEK